MAKQPRSKGRTRPRAGLPPLKDGARPFVVTLSDEGEELIDSAVELLKITSQSERLKAREHIRHIIVPTYLAFAQIENDAPRPADVFVTLHDVAERASALRSALRILDWWSLNLLQDHEAFRTFESRKAPRTELHALFEGDDSAEIFIILKDIESGARRAAEEFGDDRGGSRKLKMMGPPLDNLVGLCQLCFEQYRPSQPGQTLGRGFQLFASFIYEAATGQKSELERPIRRLSKRLKSSKK